MIHLVEPLQTERLLIRECVEEDFDSVAALLADPEVMRYSLKGAMTREEAKVYFEKLGFWGVFAKEDKRFVGIVGLISQQIDGIEELELGFRLARSEWGKGFATEAVTAVRDFAFATLDCDHLISIIDPTNARSASVAKRVGMLPVKETTFHGVAVQIYQVTPVRLTPYQEEWPKLFQEEKERLTELFSDLPLHIFHIGSTAIVGAKAKPVIDILIVVNQRLDLAAYGDSLKELGYNVKGECGVRGRVFAQKKGEQWFHLHFFEEGDPEIARHLRFVPYLNRHHMMRDKYVSLKERLSQKFAGDRHAYTMKKTKLIKELDYMAAKEAEEWVQLPALGSKKSTWTKEEIIQALDDNTHLQMTYFATYVPSREVLSEPDVTVVQAPTVKDDTFNVILSARFEEKKVAERINHVVALFKEKELPFSWWVGPLDTPGGLVEALKGQGLAWKEESVAMYKELSEEASEIPEDLEFKRVVTEEDLFDFDSVHVGAEGNPEVFEKLFRPIPPVLYQEGAPWEMYTGYIDGKPIVTGVLVLHAQVAGIYYLATLPKHRRKGYGTAMMHYLMQQAQDKGYSLSILHASSMGKGLYERLGFKTCGSYHEYS